MADDKYDKRCLFESTVGKLTILEIMRRIKTAEGRRSMTAIQISIAERINKKWSLNSLIQAELQSERNEKEKDNGGT